MSTNQSTSELLRKYSDLLSEGLSEEKYSGSQKDLSDIKEIHIPAVKSALNIIDNSVGVNNLNIQTDRIINAIMKAEWHLEGIRMKLGLKNKEGWSE